MIAWCDGNPGKKVFPTAGSDDYYQIYQIIKRNEKRSLIGIRKLKIIWKS